jgi:predicted nucleotidyltransferase component of viral defense system
MARISFEQAESILQALGEDFLGSAMEIKSALAEDSPWSSFQLLHVTELFKFDIFVPRDDEFVREMHSRAMEVTLGAVRLKVLSPEDILIQKLRWYDLGNRVSDRQWNDIVQVMEVQAGKLDKEYITRWARHFGLEDLMNEAFGEALD